MSKVTFILNQDDGGVLELPPSSIDSFGCLKVFTALKTIGQGAYWFAWLGGRCERLIAKPSELDRWVVKVLDDKVEGGTYSVSCLSVEVKVAQ